MVFRSILVAIAIAACVHAAPTSNDIVPETKFVEAAAISPHAAAKQTVTQMLQAGSDWTTCEELANSTREEVTDAVTSTQDMLDSLDKGCNCAGLGQDEVSRTLNEMNAYVTAVTVAERTLDKATNAQVQLSSQTFQSLQAGACGWIVTDVSYISAHTTYTTAVTTLATTRTAHSLSVTSHTDAVTEAARLKLECECDTQNKHANEWADANADNDANAAAWAQAHHIDCVVQSISEADCVFGPAPGLTKPILCDNIESVLCPLTSDAPIDASSTDAPTPTGITSLLYTGHGCGQQTVNLGNLLTVAECAADAATNSACHGSFMWAPIYNYAWGCRCCISGDDGSHVNENWNVYSY